MSKLNKPAGGEENNSSCPETQVNKVSTEVTAGVNSIIEQGENYVYSKERLLIFIKNGDGDDVAKNFEKFHGIPEEDHKEIALLLIEKGYCYDVARSFEKFHGIPEEDHKKIALKLIQSGYSNKEYFYKFYGIKESFEEFYEKYNN